MSIKFGPTEVTVTSLSQIKNGSLEIGGMSIDEIVKNMTYRDLAKKMWTNAGADASLFWVKPEPLRMKQVFSLYSESVSVLQVLRSIIYLVPEDKNYWRDAARLLVTMVASVAAFGVKSDIVANDSDSLAEYFLKTLRGNASKNEIKAFDSVMLIHAENELNLSTFGLRLAASAGASFRESIAAAMGILSGPLHGGASAEVMRMFEEIAEQKNSEAWIDRALQEKRKIMGFGHLLYKEGDPRALLLKKIARDLAGDRKDWFQLAESLETLMLAKKGLRPNIDFYSAVIYKLLEIPKELAVGIFAMSRMLGWALHYDEQKRVRSIITPVARYEI